MNRTTKCGDLYAPGLYLCAECKSGYYSTSWDPSCSPCASSNGTYHGSSLSSDSNEFIILAISVFSYISFLALSVVLIATFVRGDRKQGIYRARRFFMFALSSLQVLAQMSQQATGYEDEVVLKIYGYLNMVTTLDPADALPYECMNKAIGGPFLLPNIIMICAHNVFNMGVAMFCASEMRLCCFSHKNKIGEKIHIYYRVQRFLLGALTMTYSMASRVALNHVSCAAITVQSSLPQSQATVYVLRTRPSIKCFSEVHAVTGTLECLRLCYSLWAIQYASGG